MSRLPELPWWWLRDAECRALGIGTEARRTEGGVVFGDGKGRHRVEVVARTSDAPLTVGEVSLRLWGDGADPRARLVLAAAGRFLGARRGTGFHPERSSLPLTEAQQRSGGETREVSRQVSREIPPTIIDVPSVCERACVFCEISRKPIAERFARGKDADVERAIDAAPGPVLLTGDDALSNPRIVDLVARAAGHSSRRAVEIIGPPRLGKTAALAAPLAAAGLRLWHTGIFGPDAASHDAVAGLDGAFAALLEAAPAMRAAGVKVELLTPLVSRVVPNLAAIAARASSLSSEPLTIMAYAPDAVAGSAFDDVVPGWDAIRSALATVSTLRVHVDGVPLCVLPESLRTRGGGTLDRTDEGFRTLHPDETCAPCSRRSACPGIAASSYRAVGSAGLLPIAAPAAPPAATAWPAR